MEKTGGRINEHTTGKQTQERRLREEKVQEREESKNVKWQKMKNGEDSRKRENKI